MRTGVISDIHGNVDALEAVLREMSRHRLDRIVCLGDVVGYGGAPDESCRLVRQHCMVCLLGNHDAAVTGRMDYTFYYEAARQSLDWTRSVLTDDNLVWLANLPYEVRLDTIHLVHSSPVDPPAFEYVYLPEHATKLIPHARAFSDVTFIGHSHLCRVFAYTGGVMEEIEKAQFRLRQADKYVVAVGSVGQPRDYDPRAGFVIFDEGLREISFYRVEYPVERAAQRIVDAGLPPNFARRLHFGV